MSMESSLFGGPQLLWQRVQELEAMVRTLNLQVQQNTSALAALERRVAALELARGD